MRSLVMKGLDRIQQRFTDPEWIQVPAGTFLRDWREDMRQEAIERAPRYTEELVRAIESAQDTRKFPLWARVFADVPQARWAEYGTGLLSEDPDSAKQAYFPNIEGIRNWAIDHGLDPYMVALGIFERGGTPPTHFFSDAERAADLNFNIRISRFGQDVEARVKVDR